MSATSTRTLRASPNAHDVAIVDRCDVARLGDHREIAEKVVRKMRAGLMPPTNMSRPDQATFEAWIRWMEDELDRGSQVGFLQERLVALHVGDVRVRGVLGAVGDLGDPVRAGRMLARGHLDGRAERTANLGDLLGVRGDHRVIQDGHRLHTTPHPFDERTAEDRGEGLVGEAGRREPGRHDAENLAVQRALPEPERRRVDANFTPGKLPENGGTGQPESQDRGRVAYARLPLLGVDAREERKHDQAESEARERYRDLGDGQEDLGFGHSGTSAAGFTR